MRWLLVTALLVVPVCCTYFHILHLSSCPLKTLLNTGRSTTLLIQSHRSLFPRPLPSHCNSQIKQTDAASLAKTPPVRSGPVRSGYHCIFIPSHHVTLRLLQYSKSKHSVNRCVGFLKGVTSHIWLFSRRRFVSQMWTHVRQHTSCLSTSLVFVSRSEHYELPSRFASFSVSKRNIVSEICYCLSNVPRSH
jgi:hypothetical protein